MNSKSLLLFLIIAISHSSFSSSDYPISKEEAKRKESGSLIGGDGIVIKSGKININSGKKSQTKYSNSDIYDVVFNSAKKIISDLPISTLDHKTGTIITDWYSTVNKPNYSYKVQITVKNAKIIEDTLEVKVFEKKLIGGQWYNQPDSKNLSSKYIQDILSETKNFYNSKN